MKRKNLSVFLLLFLLCLLLFFLDLIAGSSNIPAKEVFRILTGGESHNSTWSFIILESRLPRAFTAALCGAALSLSGLLMQTLFRNPLAGPYVLGVSSGASFGAAILILAAGSIGFSIGSDSYWPLVIAAWCGAAMVLFLIFSVSLFIKNVSVLLIIGLMFGSALGALVSILQYFAGPEEIKIFVLWTMGSLSGVNGMRLGILAFAFFISLLMVLYKTKALNGLLLGEEYSRSLGFTFKNTALLVVLATSLMAGTVTALCGPIAFVGIAVPHISRFVLKTSDHKILIPAAVLLGAAFLLACDALSQLPGHASRLPINTITALLGAPVVIAVILRNRHKGSFFN